MAMQQKQNANQAKEAAQKPRTAEPVGQKPVAPMLQTNQLALQRAVADPRAALPRDILALQRLYGNRAVTRLLQTKLMVGPAGDKYEQEADRVAEQVVSSPTGRLRSQRSAVSGQPTIQRQEDEDELQFKPLAASITPLVQRQEDEDELQFKPLVQRQEDEDELQFKPLVQRQEDEDELQFKSNLQSPISNLQASPDVESRLAANKGGGSPLPDDVRATMEPRFGADFSGVRIHTDSQAVQMSRELKAQAFTHGQDIYMGAEKYDPNSDAGKRLLAHELTHVVQQSGGAVQPAISRSDDVVQRYEVLGPKQGVVGLTANVNNLEVNKRAGTAFYVLKQKAGVSLKVSIDHKMAVPDVPETKDFYATAGLITAANAVLQGQGSVVSISQGGLIPVTLLAGGGDPLYKVNVTSTRGSSPALNDMAKIQNECIKTAQLIATGAEGGESSQAILGGTGMSSESLRYPNIPTTIGGYVPHLSPGRKQEMGVNQFAVPQMGQILTTFDALSAKVGKNTWSYHFAAVVARSGNDYVTLENVNRASEVNEALEAVWAVLGKTQKGLQRYQEALTLYDLAGLGPAEQAEQRRKAQVYALQQLADAQTKTNLLSDIAGAAWYFQMYGPLEQSFHAEMAKSGAFGEAFTVLLGKKPAGPQTEGIDPRVLEIVEPEQATGLGKLGAISHLAGEGAKAQQLKEDARSLAAAISRAPDPTALFGTLDDLDRRLAGLSGRTADKARYILQVLHLRLAIKKKALEIAGRADTEAAGTLATLEPIFRKEVLFYGNTVLSVLGHRTFATEFAAGTADLMKQESIRMVQELRTLQGKMT
jgi:Domain of unknown function (DUF4157)